MSAFVSLPLSCPPDRCWIEVDAEDRDFDCVPWADVINITEKIIRCAVCGRPAIQLDHFYPHFYDKNRCQLCLDMESRRKDGELMKAPSLALVKQGEHEGEHG